MWRLQVHTTGFNSYFKMKNICMYFILLLKHDCFYISEIDPSGKLSSILSSQTSGNVKIFSNI